MEDPDGPVIARAVYKELMYFLVTLPRYKNEVSKMTVEQKEELLAKGNEFVKLEAFARWDHQKIAALSLPSGAMEHQRSNGLHLFILAYSAYLGT